MKVGEGTSWASFESHSFQHHFLTFDETQQYGTEPVADAIPFFFGFDAFGHIELLAGVCSLEGTFAGIPHVTFFIEYATRSDQFFHCVEVILLFFTGRQVSPLPSMTPLPVMAMFSAPLADMGDWQRRVSNPSKEVLMIGYCVWSAVKSTNAFSSRWRLMLLFSTIGPVSHKPAGTTTVPPPFGIRLRWFARKPQCSV